MLKRPGERSTGRFVVLRLVLPQPERSITSATGALDHLRHPNPRSAVSGELQAGTRARRWCPASEVRRIMRRMQGIGRPLKTDSQWHETEVRLMWRTSDSGH